MKSKAEKSPNLYRAQQEWRHREIKKQSEIGDLHSPKNPGRRESCRLDLFCFLTSYFPMSTGLSPFSEDHRRVIERIQRCILHGGLQLNAVFRGWAKSTITENSAIWALIYGHRKFVPIFGAGAGAAEGNMDSIKTELQENDLLWEDFAEVCVPIRHLEGKPQRCASQTYEGDRTKIEWSAEKIVLATIPGAASSGGVLIANGITAATRGVKHKMSDGTQQRPDFIMLDDIQDDEAAASASQVNKLARILKKSILKLGGHGRRTAVVMNATVIEPEDLIDQLLDPKRNPNWQGERIKMVKRWANAHDTLWTEYARIRSSYDPLNIEAQDIAHKDATEFYKRNREEMDKGCIVSWEHCYDKETEHSAIQHAYNCFIDDGPEVFASECQNEPLRVGTQTDYLTAKEIAEKINGLSQGIAPLGAEILSAMIDVQGDVLYYAVGAFSKDFTGGLIDYATFPRQNLGYFTLASASNTLKALYPEKGLEARIYAALDSLTKELLEREWRREDGAVMKISRCLIDANWGKTSGTVTTFCRRSAHSTIIMPSFGRYVGAASIPWEQYSSRPGERLGHHWLIPAAKPGKPQRHITVDVNYWKSFLHTRLKSSIGDRGCFSLFGDNPELHRMVADHYKAEYSVKTRGRGREVEEWKEMPGSPDNHLLDCTVGCLVGASEQGASLHGDGEAKRIGRRVKLSDLQKRAG